MKFLICAVIFMTSSMGRSDEKVYSIENDNGTLVKIVDENNIPLNSIYMKDPLPPNVNVYIPPPKIKPIKKAKLQIIPSKIHLKEMVVKGRFTRPAIEFDQEKLPVERVFEPLEKNFIDKVSNKEFAH